MVKNVGECMVLNQYIYLDIDIMYHLETDDNDAIQH